MRRVGTGVSLFLLFSLALGLDLPACGQSGTTTADEAAARQSILDSERWRQTQRKLDEWLSVQQIYTEQEVAALRKEYQQRIAQMTPRQLEDFLKDTEARLTVLLSPEAKEARRWLAGVFATARDPIAHLGREVPDVANMTATQIRQELLWVEQRLANSRQSQAAFDRGRAMKVERAQNWHQANRQAQEHARDLRAEAARPRVYRSAYAPTNARQQGPDLRPINRRPMYRVGPWGTPIRWDPFSYR